SAGKEIAPVAKQLEKIQPVLQKLSEQPTGAPPAPLPKEQKTDIGIEPKGKPPLPPGLPPKD
ncbi:MAG: hypothetical protein JNM56_28980, partial [Planctomycetia bacterium]|nr:hypothetical protein [Planctomycetia bacterium]